MPKLAIQEDDFLVHDLTQELPPTEDVISTHSKLTFAQYDEHEEASDVDEDPNDPSYEDDGSDEDEDMETEVQQQVEAPIGKWALLIYT
ncbi:hypothetical protein LTR17_001434 [Elasticomyces elasticus]|nr:hypothetical protein LTR17_001434 [Elasticomyces elasticus]